MISEEAQTIATILRHTMLVGLYLWKLVGKLWQRGVAHDASKLSEDEFSGFVQINKIARTCEYGSPEYKASLAEVNAVPLHYSRNSHHPEHFRDGVDGMSLVDIVEMVADWKAAAETYGQTSLEKSLEIQANRFGLQEKHLYLIGLILDEL